MGTGQFASWHQHLGYGPSAFGDMESLVYIVMTNMAEQAGSYLPWDASALGLGSTSRSRSMGEVKLRLVHDLPLAAGSRYSRVKAPKGMPIADEIWKRWWQLLQSHAEVLRTDQEMRAAADLAAFLLQELMNCEAADVEACKRPEQKAALQPPPPTRRKRVSQEDESKKSQPSIFSKEGQLAHFRGLSASNGDKAEVIGRPILETSLGVLLPKREGKIRKPSFKFLRPMQRDAEGDFATFEVNLVADKVSGSNLHNLQLDKKADVYMHSIQPIEPPTYDAWKGMQQEPEIMFVAEFIMSMETSKIKGKLGQLEASLFCQGMHYPGKVLERPVVAAVVYAGQNDFNFSVSDTTLLSLPRCRALAMQGRLFGIRMKDSQLMDLLQRNLGYLLTNTQKYVLEQREFQAEQRQSLEVVEQLVDIVDKNQEGSKESINQLRLAVAALTCIVLYIGLYLD